MSEREVPESSAPAAAPESRRRRGDTDERKRELASLVVHDLRNPIAAMLGYLELLATELGQPGEVVQGLLGDLRALADRALAMANLLLDVEELEEGVLVAHARAVRLDEFIAGLIQPYRSTGRLRDLELVVEVPAVEVSFDPDLIGRVVENLLDNAVRYASRRGRVEVRAALQGGWLEVRIGNDGPPVPEAQRTRIFERYYRSEARRAAARESRGLGLYFCKLAVLAHHGSLTLEVTESLPAVFVLRLPQ